MRQRPGHTTWGPHPPRSRHAHKDHTGSGRVVQRGSISPTFDTRRLDMLWRSSVEDGCGMSSTGSMPMPLLLMLRSSGEDEFRRFHARSTPRQACTLTLPVTADRDHTIVGSRCSDLLAAVGTPRICSAGSMLVPHPSERLVVGMSSVGSMPTPRIQRDVGDTGVTTEKIISRPGRTGHLVVQRGVHIPHVQDTPDDDAVTVRSG